MIKKLALAKETILMLSASQSSTVAGGPIYQGEETQVSCDGCHPQFVPTGYSCVCQSDEHTIPCIEGLPTTGNLSITTRATTTTTTTPK